MTDERINRIRTLEAAIAEEGKRHQEKKANLNDLLRLAKVGCDHKLPDGKYATQDLWLGTGCFLCGHCDI